MSLEEYRGYGRPSCEDECSNWKMWRHTKNTGVTTNWEGQEKLDPGVWEIKTAVILEVYGAD